jgi:hypothetical protein
MRHDDLITLSREQVPRRIRTVLAAGAFFAIWMGVLVSCSNAIFARAGTWGFLVAAAVPVVLLLAVAVRNLLALPKCPHCGIRLAGWMLQTAVASGKCGFCGRRIDG